MCHCPEDVPYSLTLSHTWFLSVPNPKLCTEVDFIAPSAIGVSWRYGSRHSIPTIITTFFIRSVLDVWLIALWTVFHFRTIYAYTIGTDDSDVSRPPTVRKMTLTVSISKGWLVRDVSLHHRWLGPKPQTTCTQEQYLRWITPHTGLYSLCWISSESKV